MKHFRRLLITIVEPSILLAVLSSAPRPEKADIGTQILQGRVVEKARQRAFNITDSSMCFATLFGCSLSRTRCLKLSIVLPELRVAVSIFRLSCAAVDPSTPWAQYNLRFASGRAVFHARPIAYVIMIFSVLSITS